MRTFLIALVLMCQNIALGQVNSDIPKEPLFGQGGDGRPKPGDPTRIRENLKWDQLEERRKQLLEMITGKDLKNRVFNQVYRMPLEWINNGMGEQDIYAKLLSHNLIDKIRLAKFQYVGQTPEGETKPITQCAEVDGKPAPMSAVPGDTELRVCFDVEKLVNLKGGPVTNAELVGEVIHEFGHLLLKLGSESDTALENLATQISKLAINLSVFNWKVSDRKSIIAYEYFPSISTKIGMRAFAHPENNSVCKLSSEGWGIPDDEIKYMEIYSSQVHRNWFGASCGYFNSAEVEWYKSEEFFPFKKHQSKPVDLSVRMASILISKETPKGVSCRYKVGIYDHQGRLIDYYKDGTYLEVKRGLFSNLKQPLLYFFENSVDTKTVEN